MLLGEGEGHGSLTEHEDDHGFVGAEQVLRAIRLKERSGDLHQIAIGYSNLAETELAMKELAAARDHARRAVRIGEQSRAGSDLADMYRNLAEAELGTGDLGAALAAGQKALAIAETRGQVYLGDVATIKPAQAAPVRQTKPAHVPFVDPHVFYQTVFAPLDATLDGAIGKLLDQPDTNYGFDAQTLQYGDLTKAGIVDPTKVVRLALQDAASIAGLLITTEVMVAGEQQAGAQLGP